MAIERRYTEPLQVVDTPEKVARIERLATVRKVSKAAIVRELTDAGIEEAERAAGIDPGSAVDLEEPEPVAHAG